jgi:hypothetical protein
VAVGPETQRPWVPLVRSVFQLDGKLSELDVDVVACAFVRGRSCKLRNTIIARETIIGSHSHRSCASGLNRARPAGSTPRIPISTHTTELPRYPWST